MPETLRDFAAEIRTLEPFDTATLETKTKAFCESRGVKLGDLNHAVRVATTGVMIGPGVFDLLAILGREESLRRIEQGARHPGCHEPPRKAVGEDAANAGRNHAEGWTRF